MRTRNPNPYTIRGTNEIIAVMISLIRLLKVMTRKAPGGGGGDGGKPCGGGEILDCSSSCAEPCEGGPANRALTKPARASAERTRWESHRRAPWAIMISRDVPLPRPVRMKYSRIFIHSAKDLAIGRPRHRRGEGEAVTVAVAGPPNLIRDFLFSSR